MPNNKNLNFKQQRDLGDIINDTFRFIRENYKPLFHYIYKLVGPFFILLILAVGHYTYTVAGSPLEAITGRTGGFIISFLILAVSLLLFYAALYGTVLHYIKSYINNNGMADNLEVKTGVKNDYFNLILLSVLSGILVIAGL